MAQHVEFKIKVRYGNAVSIGNLKYKQHYQTSQIRLNCIITLTVYYSVENQLNIYPL